MIVLSTTCGDQFVIEDQDLGLFDGLAFFSSYQDHAGENRLVQIYVRKARKTVPIGRIILNAAKGICVDHRDGNVRNNLRSNLRFATHAENARNRRRRADSELPFKGITKRIRKSGLIRYAASIYVQSKPLHLGTFSTPEAAHAAYAQAATLHFGEFARLQ